jgi:hypothetical protein
MGFEDMFSFRDRIAVVNGPIRRAVVQDPHRKRPIMEHESRLLPVI